MSVALRVTGRASLAGFGEGWRESSAYYENAPSREEHLLIRREFDGIEPEGLKALAFSIGRQIENGFGCKEARFLARIGRFTGQIDPRHAAW